MVLVTIDSVRADHCGFLSESETTPTLDEIASNSVVFENAIAPGPQTLSSVPAIHTGTPLPVTDHQITSYGERINRIKEHIGSHRTIAEEFGDMGYSTACVEANPWTSSTANFDKGFDYFYDVGGEQRKHVSNRFEGTALGPPIRTLKRWYNKDGWFSRWPQFYDQIISVIEELSEPYFVWIFLLDTHNPYFVGRKDRVESSAIGMYYSLARANSVLGGANDGTNYKNRLPPHVETRVKRAYRDSIRSVDRFIDALLTDTADDDPILALYSDHGEAFGEHDTYGHQHQLYEENIHVPFLVYNVGMDERVSDPISLLKLTETLKKCVSDDSTSLSDWTNDYVFSRTEDSSTVTVRGERWKYISTDSSEQLFDLKKDPEEQVDLSSEEMDQLQRLRSLKERRMESLPQKDVSLTENTNEELKERLDALGYVG
ncbi:sulfatase-like hydrolase/transferase [Haloarchaeobius sp. HRN-SO-5]|uniref:sulfatase-like hydrolase/transferase n=1 Tax=Haloarchaeobius sp. HRN-SO-5 TaxID=3446118 RepID=UPI003EBCD732